MLKKIRSLKLVNMVTVRNLVSFDRTDMREGSELEISFTYDLLEPADGSEVTDVRKLQFRVVASETGDVLTPLKIELDIDYIFEIVDKKTVESMHEEEIAEMLSSQCYLDARRRFYSVLNSFALSGIKLPLSISELS
ncbi:MAG: hypothetical protein KIB04_09755 [Pantoea sp.]|nr:hypothetical protein [Pantoea sp.]